MAIVYISKWLKHKGRMIKVDAMDLGSIKTEKEFVKKVFSRNGPGRYSIVTPTPRFDGLWVGRIQENKDELVVQVGEDGYSHLENKIGLEELKRSPEGMTKISKPKNLRRSEWP